MKWILLLHATSTLLMVGVIWMVQLVHYPLFLYANRETFVAFQKAHMFWISWVVIPPTLVELATGAYLVFVLPENILYWIVLVGGILVVVIWFSTFLFQVPKHEILSQGFDEMAHSQLVLGNWIRTIAWSLRGVLVVWMLVWRMSSL